MMTLRRRTTPDGRLATQYYVIPANPPGTGSRQQRSDQQSKQLNQPRGRPNTRTRGKPNYSMSLDIYDVRRSSAFRLYSSHPFNQLNSF